MIGRRATAAHKSFDVGSGVASRSRVRLIPLRRDYKSWVADDTIEDYALRFTPPSARRFGLFAIANTAFGTTSFMALEVLGALITLAFGTRIAVAAILSVGALLFVLGLPITLAAARRGIDIDLLTRGAGFGYLGATVTSLIYASFTFIFFALEASILAEGAARRARRAACGGRGVWRARGGAARAARDGVHQPVPAGDAAGLAAADAAAGCRGAGAGAGPGRELAEILGGRACSAHHAGVRCCGIGADGARGADRRAGGLSSVSAGADDGEPGGLVGGAPAWRSGLDRARRGQAVARDRCLRWRHSRRDWPVRASRS